MAKPVSEWSEADLIGLLGQQEGQGLEFKASAALDNETKKVAELVKDATAMANADGGLIVYGLVEDADGFAAALDEGSDTKPEWIEQILTSNCEPRIAGLAVHRIRLASGRFAYVVEVPKATAFAPHQSRKDLRYHRRHGRMTLQMYDHEVRDLMRRSTQPELFLEFTFSAATTNRYAMGITINNRSSEPALYGTTLICLDKRLDPPSSEGTFTVQDLWLPAAGGKQLCTTYRKHFNVPSNLPIFAGVPWAWMTTSVSIQPSQAYLVLYRIACPGFAESCAGFITRDGTGEPQIRFASEAGVGAPI